MKKLIAILLLTTAFIALCCYVPYATEASIPEISLIQAKNYSYSNTVTASGEVIYENEHKVKSSVPVVIKEYTVKIGDEVQSGDQIAEIDREATKKALAKMSSDINYKAVIASAGGISALEGSIPDKLYSGKSGVVTSLSTDTGTLLLQNSEIASVSSSDNICVTLSVGEADSPKIKNNQKAKISGKALNRAYSAKVTAISPTARKKYTGTGVETVVDITLEVEDADSLIKSGYSVMGEIVVEDEKTALILPYSAILQDDNGEYVYIYEHGSAVRKNIKTGAELSKGIEVLSGISESEFVIANPEKAEKSGLVTVKK